MTGLSSGIALIGLVVGFLVGLTGIGGRVILTPLLIYLGMRPTLAVGTDLVYGSLTKVVGAFQHYRLGHVNGRWVVFLAIGSIPASLAVVLVIDHVRWIHGSADAFLLYPLGAVLLVSSLAIIAGELLHWFRSPGLGLAGRRGTGSRFQPVNCAEYAVNPHPLDDTAGPVETAASAPPVPPGIRLLQFLLPEAWINGWLKAPLIILLGAGVGFMVGLTSVGSGSLLVLALVFFSRLGPREVVGTNVAQGAILVTAAALAHTSIGTVDFRLAANLLAGSLPGVILGSRTAAILPHRPLKVAWHC